MKKLKTLIIVTPGFPANENDSTCLPPQQVFVKALQQANPSLRVIVLAMKYPFFSRTYKWHGIKVISFGNRNHTKISSLFSLFKIWITLRRLKKEENLIGLLSFWLDKSALIADYFAKQNSLPHFCWLLGQDAKEGNKYVKLIRPNEEFLIALSDFIAREFKKNYDLMPKNIIPIGIEETRFTPEESDRRIDVLGAGSLIPLKQYDVFLQVVKELSFTFPNIKAVICGEGPELKNLNTLIAQLGLAGHVSLRGALPHHEVLQLMKETKLFLHTAKYEGFGAVNLEALYAGAKVISFVKPMDVSIENWAHAYSFEEMTALAKKILADPAPLYKKVMPFPIHKITKAVLALYDL